MIASLNHRGPDDNGIWFDYIHHIGLAHARLSIIDLSHEGHQPMLSSCARYIMVFNGEIYNHQILRSQLNKSDWRGESDSETLLEFISKYGIEITLKKAIGMFAIAIWDKKQNTLSLMRDRMGEKPLYYGFIGKDLVFASELKAFKHYRNFNNSINQQSLALFLKLSHVPAPHTIYENIHKIEPGQITSFSHNGKKISNTTYWNTKNVLKEGFNNIIQGSTNSVINELEALLIDALSLQMKADVPLGAFLSGGVDSSTIVALMQAQSQQKIKTFSIGFYEDRYNEAKYAKSIAKHLHTEHYEYVCE